MRVLPRALLLFAISSPALGCGLIPGLGTSGSGGSSAASSVSSSSGAGSSTIGTGSDCGQDPNTGFTLCLGNSLCPGLTIDTSSFPGCGFLVLGSSINVECSCSGYICPVSGSTCAAVSATLASSNQGAVCAEVSNGTCMQGTPVATSSASSSGGAGGSSSSSCDTTCRDSCDGDPTCIEACGC